MNKTMAKMSLATLVTALRIGTAACESMMKWIDEMPDDKKGWHVVDNETKDWQKISECQEAGDEIPNFDGSFLESLENGLSKYGKLTEKQSQALDNLHFKLVRSNR